MPLAMPCTAASVVGYVAVSTATACCLTKGRDRINAMSKQRLIDGAVGRDVDVRRTVVAVDAIHVLRRQSWRSAASLSFESFA